MKPTFSIRYKFLSVITLLLCLCVTAYLALAITVFKRDKTELVFDFNKSGVVTVASDVQSKIKGISDKMEVFAVQSIEQKKLTETTEALLKRDSEIVHMSARIANNKVTIASYVDDAFIETYALEKNYFENQLPSAVPVPFEKINTLGEFVWNASLENGPPLVGIGKSVIKEPDTYITVVSYFRPDSIMQGLSTSELTEAFILNNSGELLVHPNTELNSKRPDLKDDPIFKMAQKSSVKTQVVEYTDHGDQILGAFNKIQSLDIIVASRVKGSKAFLAVNQFVTRSLVFGLIIVTLSFIVAVLFSATLTRPIDTLMNRMDGVAKGDLLTPLEIKTKDEIYHLAQSFNSMITDLRNSRELLEETNRDLEKKVIDRTKKLEEQNRAVKSAQEALLKTTRLASVGEIAGKTAHEVLNPLTSIIARIQKIENQQLSNLAADQKLFEDIKGSWFKDYIAGGFETLISSWKKPSAINKSQNLWEEDQENLEAVAKNWSLEVASLRDDLGFLLRESERISRIVNRMRSLSHVNSEKRPLSIHNLLQESVNIMADLFSRNAIEISLYLEANGDISMVDKDEFIQTMTNLMRNSIQAITSSKVAPEVKPLVKIKTFTRDGVLNIDIEDNGPGIQPENQTRLFETQFSTKSNEEGTGLGLGICRRFIRSFDGDVRFVHSKPQESTLFNITLPLANEQKGSAA